MNVVSVCKVKFLWMYGGCFVNDEWEWSGVESVSECMVSVYECMVSLWENGKIKYFKGLNFGI